VHGANFCAIACFRPSGDGDGDDGIDVKFAKRTAIIGGADDAEDFYNCRSAGLLRELAPSAERALRQLADAAEAGHGPRPLAIHIYGELFGGKYPHPGVPAVQGLDPVQVGVWYAPDLRFMAFDVCVELQDARSYLDFSVSKQVCEACGFMFAQPLCRGTLNECLDFEIEFESTIPGLLGLPPLPRGAGGAERNLAEGVVVRPSQEPSSSSSTRSKSSGKESLRGLFKRKIEAFSEKRYQNDDWKKGKAGGGGKAPAVAADELALIEITAMVTEQRLANVLSKCGRVDPSDRAACRQLLQDFKQDVADALDPPEAEFLAASREAQSELDRLCREAITRELMPRKRGAASNHAPN